MNKPAFPIKVEYDQRQENGTWAKNIKNNFGLTKREYFAAKALQGILSCREIQLTLIQDKITWEEFAVKKADDLLNELSKPLPHDTEI